MSASDDLEILARTVHGEARGETFDGALAVAWVVVNRVRQKIRGESVRECCLAPAQFSCWLAGDPNLRVIATASVDSDPSFMRSKAAAAAALSHALPDPTGQATDYHALEITPDWAKDYTLTARIGSHQFYRRS